MNVHQLDDETARDFLATHPLSIVLFKAPWCGACRTFEPTFGRVAARQDDLAFCLVDTSESPGVRDAFGVGSVPHIAVVRDRELAFAHTGPLSEDAFESMVRQVRDAS